MDRDSNENRELPAPDAAGQGPGHGGFTPINVRKRPLTPTTASGFPVPTKRLAVEGALEPEETAGDEYTHQLLLPSSRTMDFQPNKLGELHTFRHAGQTPPSIPSEIPETPPGVMRLPPAYIATEPMSEDADMSWMNQFVNLDQESDKGCVTNAPNAYHEGSQSLSERQADRESDQPAQALNKDDAPMDYLADDYDEDELVQLMELVEESRSKVPPSSVIHKMDRDSTSATSYDEKLQHSPPTTSKPADRSDPFTEPDLLDEDIDWDLVVAFAAKAATSYEAKPVDAHAVNLSRTVSSHPSPFVRPPVLPKIRDRSVVAGFSTAVLMRTCFRIGDLLNAHVGYAREQQDVVLELFARVTYSSRETIARKQHFQLRDLFTDRQPFLSGIFKDWKTGGPVDEESRVFVGDNGKDKLCRCLCQLIEDKKATIGRSAKILFIRETNWEEVDWARRIITRDAEEDDKQDG